tara:strand:- start:32236 stop:33213 length:978 start_codon:yes stop_codon:yes gene_type:complete
MRSKVFFINGGAGRVVASIPALEKYAETHDDFIIVCEGGMNFYRGHPVLHKYAYDNWHKGLFEDKIKDRDCITPEPYRQWHYYNQKCSLSQAFDIEINGLEEPRELPAPNITLAKGEGIQGMQLVDEAINTTGKEKVIVIQPFGRGIMDTGGYMFDPTSRSFNLSDISTIINNLKKDYCVIVMSEFPFQTEEGESKDAYIVPNIEDIRIWASIIDRADHFLGCDSVGQHIAKAVGSTVTAVIGSTYPINISYPNDPKFDIIDLGEDRRTFSPIRLTMEDYQDIQNDECMSMTEKDISAVIKSCRDKLGKSVKKKVVQAETKGFGK